MNYLAHILLSGDNPEIIIGNFMADSIKGKQYKIYPEQVQIGVLLHRHIDTFTDNHHIVRQSTQRLHKKYSHYSGVIVDIFYDHFLAKNWYDYSNIPLPLYCDNFYNYLNEFHDLLPLKVQKFIPYMISDNWLLNYASMDGIQEVLQGMNKRTRYQSKMNLAINDLRYYYHDFESEFKIFFKDLFFYSKNELKILSSQATN